LIKDENVEIYYGNLLFRFFFYIYIMQYARIFDNLPRGTHPIKPGENDKKRSQLNKTVTQPLAPSLLQLITRFFSVNLHHAARFSFEFRQTIPEKFLYRMTNVFHRKILITFKCETHRSRIPCENKFKKIDRKEKDHFLNSNLKERSFPIFISIIILSFSTAFPERRDTAAILSKY